MKKIFIRYDDRLTEELVVEYVRTAFRHDSDRKGVIVFTDGVKLSYSDRAKDSAITIWKDES